MEDSVKAVDLGHDDCDSQACKDGRSRTWMLLLYPDNAEHSVVLSERLADLDWNYAGRAHDKEDGLKLHHHVVVLFKDGRKAADVAADLGIESRWLRAWDRKKKALRYLCHKDNPEKFQYDTDGIYGTIAEQAVAACSKGNELSECQAIKEITDTLESLEGPVTYSYFLGLMADKGLFAVFRRLGIIATRLIDEHNNAYRQAVMLAMAEKRPDIQAQVDNLPFYERCQILERKGFSPTSL